MNQINGKRLRRMLKMLINFCSDIRSHNVDVEELVYKPYAQMSSAYGGEFAFLPRLKSWVSSEQLL